jgi:phosphodiesterase/alkaline phosphatase D-like protein
MAAPVLTLALVVLHVAFPEVAAAANRSTSFAKEHITNGPIAEYLGDTSVSIAWSTLGSTQMSIRYGTDPTHLEQAAVAERKGRGHCHHARLDGLKPNTQYYFVVVGEDMESEGEMGTFQTLAPGSTPIKRRVIVP